MISLRKHIDGYRTPVAGESGLDAFRSSLLAMAECSQRAVPALGSALNERLQDIAGSVTAPQLSVASDAVRGELSLWADRALERHNDNEREIREIIGSVAWAAESISESGEKYAKEIGSLTGKLRAIADMNDVAVIRRSIVESTQTLKLCVERMAEDSKSSVSQLTSEVNDYRARLEESEKVSRVDALTGLANRRAFEKKHQALITAGDTFSLLMLDLNGFKTVNDTHGHLAGDDVLKQFAVELKGQFTQADLVARWGGDEFAVLFAGPLTDARARAQNVEKWVFGEYRLSVVSPPIKVPISAAVGVVEWKRGEAGTALLARADQEVYKAKASSSRQTSRAPAAKSP